MAIPADASSVDVEAVGDVLQGNEYHVHLAPRLVETIWDIGAHVGAASVMFRAYYPAARIVAWEPSRALYDCLVWNMRNDERCVLRRRAVCRGGGTQPLYHNSKYGYVCGSLKPSRFATEVTEEVEADSEQDLLKRTLRPDILKLDVEGLEVEILESLTAMLPDVPCVYVEYHSEANRLAVDRVMCETHLLGSLRAIQPHRGVCCYAKKGLNDHLELQ